MLKLRIIQAGQPDQLVEVPADEAVIGRTTGCEVVVPRPYVSKRHARVLAGLVVVDLGSRNGVFIDGQRIQGAALVPRLGFRLGGQADDVQIEVEAEDLEVPALARIREELDAERRRNAQLAAELGRRESPADGALGDVEELPVVRELRAQQADLLRRVESLKREVESRDVIASEGLQARLATDSLADVQRHNDELRRRVAELEAVAATPALQAAKAALIERVAELEGDRAEREEELTRLRAELERVKAAAQPLPASELFFRLQAENTELRKQLEQSGASSTGDAASQSGASELFFKLQGENRELRRRLGELEQSSPPAGSPAVEADSERLEELRRKNHELRMSQADLATELDQLRAKLAAAPSATSSSAADRSAAAGAASMALAAVARDDIEGQRPRYDEPAEAFLALELFRFLRQVERVVTRAASGFIQLYDSRTVLPDMEGNARVLVEVVLESPGDRDLREDLVEYLGELQKWLVVTLGAHRRGAERFAEQLRSELSERGLTADEPIPAYKKLAGLGDAELWQRAKAQLKRLTADVADERLEGLFRTCAEEILREQGRT